MSLRQTKQPPAACLLRDNTIPTMIFALDPPENIARVVCGERIGTIVR